MFWVGLAALAAAWWIALWATPLSARVAVRIGQLDRPGRRSLHRAPMPLLGGSAIFAAILLPGTLALALARVWTATGAPAWLGAQVAGYVPNAAAQAPRALGILAGAAAVHVLGLIDDRRSLPAWSKLLVELAVAAAVVIACDVRLLTIAGAGVSVPVTVLWIVAITNAFNLLDNMDGLSAGVAAICTTALLATSIATGQLFVPAWLLLLLGALLGFLPWNLPAARTYMGDAGSLLIGYFLGVLSVLVTYVPPGRTYDLYGLCVPLVLMAVPLYDMVSVVVLRIRRRHNPLVGDRRHFSHRLLQRGLSVRAALLVIYLCTATTTIAASLLWRVGQTGAILLLAQTAALLLLVALLEHGGGRR